MALFVGQLDIVQIGLGLGRAVAHEAQPQDALELRVAGQRRILEEHRETLNLIAHRLTEIETLEGQELQDLLAKTGVSQQPAAL